MPYITVRENKAKWWITVQGLNYNEVRRTELLSYLVQLDCKIPLALGETPVREAERPTGEPQRQGENGRVQRPHLDGEKEFSFHLLGLLDALLSGFPL